MNRLIIKPLTAKDETPFALLYYADPNQQAVNDYLQRGECYLGYLNDQVIAVMVLLATRPLTLELVNLAVAENHQNRGYGKQLINYAIAIAQKSGYKMIEVGTGNSSINQLVLYQKCGFTLSGIDFDYFKQHYPQPIFENGIECQHMLRLTRHL